jgi:hypothetical protein
LDVCAKKARHTAANGRSDAGRARSDQLDAYPAARAVVAGEANTGPKRGSIEPLRADDRPPVSAETDVMSDMPAETPQQRRADSPRPG